MLPHRSLAERLIVLAAALVLAAMALNYAVDTLRRVWPYLAGAAVLAGLVSLGLALNRRRTRGW